MATDRECNLAKTWINELRQFSIRQSFHFQKTVLGLQLKSTGNLPLFVSKQRPS